MTEADLQEHDDPPDHAPEGPRPPEAPARQISDDRSLGAFRKVPRTGVRQRFEERFTSHRMAQQYVDAYQSVIRAQKRSRFKVIDRSSGG